MTEGGYLMNKLNRKPRNLDMYKAILTLYNDILAETGASSATISRVNRSLQYGKDGYEIVFERLAEQKEED